VKKATLAAVLAASIVAAPARGDDASNPPPLRMTTEPEAAAAAEPEEGERLAARAVKAPIGVAGLCAGLLVGVPVKIGHDVKAETRRMLDTLLDDFGGQRSFNNYLLAAPMAVPFGIASGTVVGLVRGVRTGTKYGYSRPFSAESMSLIEPED